MSGMARRRTVSPVLTRTPPATPARPVVDVRQRPSAAGGEAVQVDDEVEGCAGDVVRAVAFHAESRCGRRRVRLIRNVGDGRRPPRSAALSCAVKTATLGSAGSVGLSSSHPARPVASIRTRNPRFSMWPSPPQNFLRDVEPEIERARRAAARDLSGCGGERIGQRSVAACGRASTSRRRRPTCARRDRDRRAAA